MKLNLYNKVILFESALRVGVSTFKGGGVELRETTSDKNLVLHYHAGYDQNYGIAAKARVHISYFPRNRSMGISLGAYYNRLFNVMESVDEQTGYSAMLQPYVRDDGSNTYSMNGPLFVRKEACNCDFALLGAFISLKLRLVETSSYNQ